jgi:hypothetical protein
MPRIILSVDQNCSAIVDQKNKTEPGLGWSLPDWVPVIAVFRVTNSQYLPLSLSKYPNRESASINIRIVRLGWI